MKVSKEWLSEYIDLTDVDYKELSNKMTLAGNELDSCSKFVEASNLVIGEILEVSDHPNADKLHVCKVDVKSEVLTIVCGAKNLDLNIKVIVALPGAVLPGNFKIKKSKIRDVESNGMLCALTELGVDSKFVTGSEKDHGIYIMPKEAPKGESALSYLLFDDEIADYELTANRADLLSMYGMAYETAALLNKKVIEPSLEIEEEIDNKIDIKINTDNCSLYSSRVVKNVEIKESPLFIKNRLIKAGIRSINNVVDISNYVMLEYGQPLHFFDFDKLGNKIEVRQALNDEKLITLDNEERILDEKDIVITDSEKAVALAGVMGGLDTEITNDTKNILIESAVFNPSSIRKTSNKILRSEASLRFEKGVDYNRSLKALNRAAYLLNKYASAEIVYGISLVDNVDKTEKEINITVKEINSLLGMEIPKDEIVDIFVKLGFEVVGEEELVVKVPSRRIDIEIRADLIEEVGRIYGYDNLKGTLPKEIIKPGKYEKTYYKIKMLKYRLKELNLIETINYSLVSVDEIKQFNNGEKEYIFLPLPMSEDKKYLRYSLLSSLVKTANYNIARNIDDFGIYEISKIHYKENDNYIEEDKMAILLKGDYVLDSWSNEGVASSFYVIKGVLDNLFKYFGFEYELNSENTVEELHPYKSAEILVKGERIGYIGEVHPNVSKEKMYVLELNLTNLFKNDFTKLNLREVSKYPNMVRDLSFVLPDEIKAEDLIKEMKIIGKNILQDITVFDVYKGENLEEGQKSLAFKLIYNDVNKTLTDDDVNNNQDKIIKVMEEKFKAILRKNI